MAARHCDEECALRDARTRTEVYADLAWLLLACGQHGAAQRLPTEYPALLLQPATTKFDSDDTLPVLKAWTHHANGDHAAAIATLRALLERDGARASVFTELHWRVDLAYFAEQAGGPQFSGLTGCMSVRRQFGSQLRNYRWAGWRARLRRPTVGLACASKVKWPGLRPTRLRC